MVKPGLPKKYAKMGFKKGWREYKKTSAYKSKYGKSSKPKSKSKSKPKGGSNKVGKNGFNTQKIFKYMRIAAIGLPGAAIAMTNWPVKDKINVGVRQYFGFDMATGKFSLSDLAKGWTPFVAASLVTIGIPKLMSMIRRG